MAKRGSDDAAFLEDLFNEQTLKLAEAARVGAGAGTRNRIVSVTSNTIIRPNDTTAYAANDIVGGVPFVFTNAAATPGGMGVIRDFMWFDSAYASGGFNLWLLFFNRIPTIAADNAAATITDAQMKDSLQGALEIFVDTTTGQQVIPGTPTAGTNGNMALLPVTQGGKPNIYFQCAPNDTNLYAVGIVATAYTPIAVEEFTVRLWIEQRV